MERIEPCSEIIKEITTMLQSDKTGDFSDTEEQAGKKTERAAIKTDFRMEFVKKLSDYITNGLVQLTIQQIPSTKEYRDAFRTEDQTYEITLNKLPPLNLVEFYPYLDVVVKQGTIDIWKKRLQFKVRSVINLKDVKITLRQQKVSCVDFGLLKADVTVYLMKGNYPVEIHSFNRDLALPTIAC
jgi:hypothetical protein